MDAGLSKIFPSIASESLSTARTEESADRAIPRQRPSASAVSWDSPSLSRNGRSSVGRAAGWDAPTTEIRHSRSRAESSSRSSDGPAVNAADWRVYFVVFMVLLLGPMRGVLREVYRLFAEDETAQLGYDEWAEALEESLVHAE